MMFVCGFSGCRGDEPDVGKEAATDTLIPPQVSQYHILEAPQSTASLMNPSSADVVSSDTVTILLQVA